MHVESGIAAGDLKHQNKNNVQQLRELVEVLAGPEITHQEGALAGIITTIVTKRRPDNGTRISYYIQTNGGGSSNGSLTHSRHSVEIVGQNIDGDTDLCAEFSVLGSDRIRRVLSDQAWGVPQTGRFLSPKEAEALLRYITPPFDSTDEEQEWRDRNLVMGLLPEEQESVERFKNQAYTVGVIVVGNMHG